MRTPMWLVLLTTSALGQNAAPAPPQASVISVRSTLVLVPALVKTHSGELVFDLTADDFSVSDDGVEQRLTLEQDTDSQPLALAIVVQTGGSGVRHLADYRGLDALIEAAIGNVQHRVAVVGFDSQPTLLQGFTADTSAATDVLSNLEPGDAGAAILDGVAFAVEELRKQPTAYRRAILLLSETVDGGSQTHLEDALRLVSNTNTAIYSFGFSSTRSALGHEARKFGYAGQPPLDPGPASGCMSRAPDADPDAHGSRAVQAFDCASELLPPLRLARMAEIASRNSLRQNAPAAVAQLTGGEFFAFKDARSLRRGLLTIINDVPNRFVLSFRPSAPHTGLHALTVSIKSRPQLELKARTAYWVEESSTMNTKPR